MTIITNFNQTAEGGELFIEFLPDHTIEALDHYFMRGWEPGGFLSALIVRDFEKALKCADHVNRARFWWVATWLNTFAPAGSVGSYELMDNWCANKDRIRSDYIVEAEKDFEWRTLSGENLA